MPNDNRTLKENLKSLAIGLAALAGLILWLHFQPKPPADWSEKGVGEPVCPEFKDASEVKEITIAKPWGGIGGTEPQTEQAPTPLWSASELTAGISEDLNPNLRPDYDEIKVVREKDGWVVKSSQDAPADNQGRMTMVLAPLLRLTVLADVSEITAKTNEADVAEFHKSCRLLDPTQCGISEMDGAGIRLTVTGENGEKFTDLIIGAVPEGSSEVRDIRYVRLPGENNVFTVDFSGEAVDQAGEDKNLPYTDRLSTTPIDWMNRNLLRISRWNIAKMTEFSYTAGEGGVIPNRYVALAQDPDRSLGRVWELTREIQFGTDGKPKETEITDESRFPNNDPFNALVDGLGHLQIAGLDRKPDTLADLVAQRGPDRNMSECADILKQRGFYFADHAPTDPEGIDPVLTGERKTIALTMKDGTMLRLLFGAKNDVGQRYLLVIPGIDEGMFPAPELKTVPEDASEEARKAAEDENNLLKSEYELNKSEAEKNSRAFSHRFDRWFFLVDEADYEKL